MQVSEFLNLPPLDIHIPVVGTRGDFTGPAPRPEEPTDAVPGSEAKILVMIARFERGEQLHHPRDRKCKLGARPFNISGNGRMVRETA